MGKGSIRRTVMTIFTMTIVAVSVLWFYYERSNRIDPPKETVENTSEIQRILNKDLENYYPESPRELIKLYSSMLKNLYSNLTAEELEALAYKMRDLYDEELLYHNPLDEYMINLYAEVEAFKKDGRKITNFLISDEKEEIVKRDGKEFTTLKVAYSIQAKNKHSENWRFLLRRDVESKWRILGWEIVQ